jgi:formylglycine-generating enzyme required for sulfatase activity
VPQAKLTVYTDWPFDANEATHRQAETAAAFGVPAKTSVDLGNGVQMNLALIPAGEFMMGTAQSPSQIVAKYGGEEKWVNNEQPCHRVRLTKPFYVATCEVTVGQFRQFVEATRYRTDAEREGWSYGGKVFQRHDGYNWRNPGFNQDDSHPVVCVSWNDARAFCEWLSEKDGKTYRLPTEAEWEYACRAGTDTTYWWGAEMDTTGRVGNVADSAHQSAGAPYKVMPMDDGYSETAPVGHYRPNGLGLYDMIGNVFEWCSDLYGSYVSGDQTDPTGSSSGDFRVIRGGAFRGNAFNSRSSYRDWKLPSFTGCDLGFRVVVENVK